jgi:hypothetical protein
MEIQYIPVLVAVVANMIIGALWYSPLLFGPLWIKAIGYSKKEIEKKQDMKKTMGWSVVVAAVTAYVLSKALYLFQAESWADGAIVGFWIWLGFVATTGAYAVLYEKKPVTVYLINSGHMLAVLAVMGTILAVL